MNLMKYLIVFGPTEYNKMEVKLISAKTDLDAKIEFVELVPYRERRPIKEIIEESEESAITIEKYIKNPKNTIEALIDSMHTYGEFAEWPASQLYKLLATKTKLIAEI